VRTAVVVFAARIRTPPLERFGCDPAAQRLIHRSVPSLVVEAVHVLVLSLLCEILGSRASQGEGAAKGHVGRKGALSGSHLAGEVGGCCIWPELLSAELRVEVISSVECSRVGISRCNGTFDSWRVSMSSRCWVLLVLAKSTPESGNGRPVLKSPCCVEVKGAASARGADASNNDVPAPNP
jgi:hypothetical protein